MIDYFNRRLGAKLLLSYLTVMLVGAVVLVIASQLLLPASFNRHMAGMEDMMGSGMGMGMGNQDFGRGGVPQLFADFRASFNEALMYAVIAAMAAAVTLSLLFSRRVVAPVRAMSLAAQRIADGRFDERVEVNGEDELARLAVRFNQMAEKLNRVESMRRRLIGDVSHELRTPLTAIKGSMEGLMDGILPANEETYQQIHAETERLNRLVDDFQELSRVESSAYELDIQAVDLPPLVRTVSKRLGPQAESKRISLNVDLSPDLPQVLADQDRIIQVLTNLANNALQYTPEGGKIIISAQQHNGEIQMSVRDTGVGLPPEHVEHIFDRFYRVDKSRSRQSGGGSGIGLTIARALVEAHSGRIWVESAGEAKGSVFHFTLPVAK